MIRLRSFAASARHVRGRSLAASARQVVRAAVATIAAVVIGSTPVLACPVCFGADESSLIDGAKLGVAALLAVTVSVQVGFLTFFLYLRKRAKRMADLDLEAEWAELQRGSTTP